MLKPEWPTNKDWQKGQSRPEHVNLRFFSAALATLIFLTMMTVGTVIKWPEIEPALYGLQAMNLSSLDPVLLLPFFMVIGFFALPRLFKEFVRWQQMRALVLKFDPVPAALSGELGGTITLPSHLHEQTAVKVTINCMRRVISSGKNSDMRDELLWQTTAVTRQLRSIKGTRVEFLAELSDQQPATSFEEKERKVWWAVRVEEASSGFDATFPVPVTETARKTSSDYRFSERERQQAEEANVQPVRSWQQEAIPGDGLSIEFPSGRSGKAAGIIMLVGVVFSGVMAFMGYNVYQELSSERTSYFAVMVQGMIMLGFSLFGPAFLIGGLYMQLNRLTLEARPTELVTTRRFMGFSKQRQLRVSDIEGLGERVVGRIGQGVESELEYAIDAYLHDGMRVRLGDGIQGQQEAERLMEQLREITGITTRTDPDSYRMQRKVPPGWVSLLPFLFKGIGALIFALTIAAFVLDFM